MPPVKNAYINQNIIFLVFNQNILWVLERTISFETVLFSTQNMFELMAKKTAVYA